MDLVIQNTTQSVRGVHAWVSDRVSIRPMGWLLPDEDTPSAGDSWPRRSTAAAPCRDSLHVPCSVAVSIQPRQHSTRLMDDEGLKLDWIDIPTSIASSSELIAQRPRSCRSLPTSSTMPAALKAYVWEVLASAAVTMTAVKTACRSLPRSAMPPAFGDSKTAGDFDLDRIAS